MAQQPPHWPDGNALLARHDSLVRGRFEPAIHRTRYSREHTEVVPGVVVTTEKFFRAPTELVERVTGDGGTILRGYDGTHAWEIRDGTARLLTGYEADTFRSTAAFYYGLLEPTAASRIPRATTVGELQMDGDSVFAISANVSTLAEAKAAGLGIVYVSKSTGLLTCITVGHADAAYFSRQTYAGYRDFGGLLIPTEWTITSGAALGLAQRVTIDEVRWDDVPDSRFELSPAVRALISP